MDILINKRKLTHSNELEFDNDYVIE